MFLLGKTSNDKLATVEPALAKVVKRAIEITPIDFSVLCGVRTLQTQYELYAKGRTRAELQAAGVPMSVLAQPGVPKVTWTLKSNHFAPPGHTLGRAVDLGVFPYDPKAGLPVYRQIKDAMFQAAEEQGVTLRWGGDWNMDGVTEHGEDDIGHFELHQ